MIALNYNVYGHLVGISNYKKKYIRRLQGTGEGNAKKKCRCKFKWGKKSKQEEEEDLILGGVLWHINP